MVGKKQGSPSSSSELKMASDDDDNDKNLLRNIFLYMFTKYN